MSHDSFEGGEGPDAFAAALEAAELVLGQRKDGGRHRGWNGGRRRGLLHLPVNVLRVVEEDLRRGASAEEGAVQAGVDGELRAASDVRPCVDEAKSREAVGSGVMNGGRQAHTTTLEESYLQSNGDSTVMYLLFPIIRILEDNILKNNIHIYIYNISELLMLFPNLC